MSIQNVTCWLFLLSKNNDNTLWACRCCISLRSSMRVVGDNVLVSHKKNKFSYCWNNLWVQQHLMLPSVYPNLQYISDNEMRQGSWSVTGIPWNIIGESNRNYSRPGAELLIFLYPLPPLPMLMLMLAPMSMYTHAVGRRALMLAWQGLLLALIIMICSIKIVR